ncbi:FtsX-like permease family protein [Shinella kummerowiae]|uniref:FtsX-like permease family protein n=1 Tax=Shinella kummerowiae TaxID=417745 RepID=A0A6N8SI78_9HYPH|nr:ABC transporter permease [Shinella kummerowiae]MXN46500.1 FtsX-like permease family protein [Shinella kummerowiae]
MIRFILADLRRFKGGALAVIVLIALSVALSVTVTLQERAVRLGSARAAEKFDLVIGAAGSETQLALSAVFLQPSPLPLMSGSVLAKLSEDSRVEFAAPVGFGDSADGHPVVGTTSKLVSALSPTLAEGAMFARLGEAVIGADVRKPVGADIKPMHGGADEGGHTHTELIYTVSGRMAPTGTAWDRAILVPIRAVWQLHGMEGEAAHDHDHAAGGLATVAAAEHEHTEEREHEAHIDPAAAIDEHFGAETPGLPAVLVKPKTVADAYRLRQEYRGETTLAVFPAEVLTRLYATLGDARSLLLAIAIGTQVIVIAAILLVTIMHIGTRQKQIGALRAFGAPARAVVAIVSGELFLLFLAGFGLGILLGYAAAHLISASLTATTAVRMPVEFAREDISLAVWFGILAVVISIIPALSALRLSPARALRA